MTRSSANPSISKKKIQCRRRPTIQGQAAAEKGKSYFGFQVVYSMTDDGVGESCDANDEDITMRLPSIVDCRSPFIRKPSECSCHVPNEDGGSDILSCTPTHGDRASGQETAASSSAINSLASFHAEEWLGIGKTRSNGIPVHVRHARDHARTIPQSLRSTFIPKTSLTVDALLCFQPPLRPPTTSASVGVRFSQDLPSVLVQDNDFMLDEEALQHIMSAVEQVSSLRQISTMPGLVGLVQHTSLPTFWVIPTLGRSPPGELETSERKHKKWLRASAWLNRVADGNRSCVMLADWKAQGDMDDPVLLTTEDLASLLSDQWVNGDMVNAGLDSHLPTTLREQPYSRRALPIQVEELVFTLFVHNSRWTVLVISLPTYTYTYCDSKNAAAKPPNKTIKLLEWWLVICALTLSQNHSSCRLRPLVLSPQSFFIKNHGHNRHQPSIEWSGIFGFPKRCKMLASRLYHLPFHVVWDPTRQAQTREDVIDLYTKASMYTHYCDEG
ncbi:uncharacterized protein B0H18DRAFT_959060 [Fomitopsis serialis]|uniref:uncharacterized protein n=1 Tax=Fomitopsis serialis TaxID=139415 RepID=UPI0020076313|nr:uncharacterized protein B0H18DRAFT_959060 [Neoantrodia serialis]KAH9916011.1 hypothetical protein B0H18DRAFT_959060 [Neoantrodia serialis]